MYWFYQSKNKITVIPSSITDLLNDDNIYFIQLSVPWSVNCNGKFRCYINVHVTWVVKANGICCIGLKQKKSGIIFRQTRQSTWTTSG